MWLSEAGWLQALCSREPTDVKFGNPQLSVPELFALQALSSFLSGAAKFYTSYSWLLGLTWSLL